MTASDMNGSEQKIDPPSHSYGVAGIEPGLRKMILIEIVFPMVLLILGIYHGLMQVLLFYAAFSLSLHRLYAATPFNSRSHHALDLLSVAPRGALVMRA